MSCMPKKPTNDEREPLLTPRHDLERVDTDRVTPLPKGKVSILLLLQLAEPMTSQVIYPFINQVSGPEARSRTYLNL